MRSSAFSLAAGYIAFSFLVLTLFAAPLWYAWQVGINDGRVELLQEDIQRFTAVFTQKGPQGLIDFMNERVNLRIAGERVLGFTDADLKPLAGNLQAWPSKLPGRDGVSTVSVPLDGRRTRVAFMSTTLPGGYHLLVGRDLTRYLTVETYFWRGLAAGILIFALVGAFGGYLIRRTLMSRIFGIDQTVSAIMRGDLTHRLATRSSGDELDTLSITINRMLEQIEQLVHGVRNVSNAIAHDLRTPLAELRSRLETVALTRPSPDETLAEIDGAVTDVDRVIRIFDALVRLAEIDTGMRRSGFTEVDVSDLVAEAVDFYLPAIELKGVSVSFQRNDPIPFLGDPVLLTQAIGNLIDNAVKYVGAGGKIGVTLAQEGENAVSISVTDNGPGIPESEKPRVTERFFRGKTSGHLPGVGLGLPLVDAVARLHGGHLDLIDNEPGLRARLVVQSAALAGGLAGRLALPAVQGRI